MLPRKVTWIKAGIKSDKFPVNSIATLPTIVPLVEDLGESTTSPLFHFSVMNTKFS